MQNIIPNIDKNEKILAYSQTIVGRLCILILFCTALYIIKFPHWEILILLPLTISFFPKYKVELVALSSIPGWFFINKYFFRQDLAHDFFMLSINQRGSIINDLHWVITCLSLLIFVTLCLSAMWIFSSTKPRPIKTVGLLTAIYLLMVHSTPLTYEYAIIHTALVIALIKFSYYYWNLNYVILTTKSIDNKSWWKKLGVVFPIWHGHDFFLLRGYAEIEKYSQTDGREFAVSQLKALKLIYWLVLIYLPMSLLLKFVFDSQSTILPKIPIPTLGIVDIREPSGYQSFNAKSYPWHYGWIAFFTDVARFLIVNLTIRMGVIISIIRICGFNVFRHTYKPYLAKDINNFFQRQMYYYNEYVLHFFFYPIWNFLQPSSLSKRARIFVSCFAAIIFAGFFHQLFYSVVFIFRTGLLNFIKVFFTGALPYYSVMGIICATSAVLKSGNKALAVTGGCKKIYQIAAVLVIYPVLVSLFFVDYKNSSWADKFQFFLLLFDIK